MAFPNAIEHPNSFDSFVTCTRLFLIKHKLLIALFLLSLLPLWVGLQMRGTFLTDDMLITLTYAKNLARGNGFIFNHSPAVLGTTTPLFALLCATLYRALPRIPLTDRAILASTICWIGIIWLFFFFRDTFGLSEWQLFLISVVIASTGWPSYLGMEVYLFSFLLILAVGLFFRSHYLSAGVTCGFLFLARGEGVLILTILGLLALLNSFSNHSAYSLRQSPVLGIICGFSMIFLPWSWYATKTFGSILPNTLAAKIAQGASGVWVTFFERMVFIWLPSWGQPLGIPRLPFVNLWYVGIVLGMMIALRKGKAWTVILAWGFLYFGGYSLLRVAGYHWYSFPIFFIFNLFFALGLSLLSEKAGRLIRNPRFTALVYVATVFLIVFRISFPMIQSTSQHLQQAQIPPPYFWLCQWFNLHASPTDSLCHFEIGYLGFYTDNPIVDLVGLTNPDIVPYITRLDFSWGFWKYQPAYVVIAENSKFDRSIIQDPRFKERYHMVAIFPNRTPDKLIVFHRIDTP
jgi:hypothetical protein